MVGRDLLIGGLLGLIHGACIPLGLLVTRWFGFEAPPIITIECAYVGFSAKAFGSFLKLARGTECVCWICVSLFPFTALHRSAEGVAGSTGAVPHRGCHRGIRLCVWGTASLLGCVDSGCGDTYDPYRSLWCLSHNGSSTIFLPQCRVPTDNRLFCLVRILHDLCTRGCTRIGNLRLLHFTRRET